MASRWTPQEEDLLRSQWRTKIRVQNIADQLGRPLLAVYLKAHKLGLPTKPNPNKVVLTREQTAWLRSNYPHIRTELCAMRLGISHRTTVRIARKLGLFKTEQFMHECQAFSAKKAKESHLKNGTFPPRGVVTENLAKGAKYRFKPGHTGHNNARKHEAEAPTASTSRPYPNQL